MRASLDARRERRSDPDEFRARVWDLAGTMSQGAIARKLGISQNLVWRLLKEKANGTAAAAAVGSQPEPRENRS